MTYLIKLSTIKWTLISICYLNLFTANAQSKTFEASSNSSNLLQFKGTDGKLVNYKDNIKQEPLLLIYFRTDCGECRHKSQFLKENASQYPVQIWMVSPEPIETLRLFEDMLGFYELENLNVFQDHTQSMHEWFDFQYIPFLVLYDKNGNEIKRLDHLPLPKVIETAIK